MPIEKQMILMYFMILYSPCMHNNNAFCILYRLYTDDNDYSVCLFTHIKSKLKTYYY
jgi:hypothetical protein